MTETAPHAPTPLARSVFAGLVPSALENRAARRRVSPKRVAFSTVPIILVGSLAAMTLNLTGSVEPVSAKPKPMPSDVSKNTRAAVASATVTAPPAVLAVAGVAPETYTVAAGDTVSEIAGRYGLSTASVLALNGLSWSSMIFPGQQIKLTNTGVLPPVVSPEPASPQSSRYTIVAGDTISSIADGFGIPSLALLTANGLSWESIIYPGQTLAVPTVDPASPDVLHVEPVVAVTPIVETPPAPSTPISGSSYTIVSGDTVSSIAGRFAVSAQSLLDANGLTSSSLIFSGETLIIPGASVASAPATSGSVTGLNDEMRANALVIIQVGRELGVSDYGIIIALATAMQESSMRNLNWGDRDSLGLFQQRPSSGWGTPDQLTTPSHAARLFYGGPSNPNAGFTTGLLDVSGWESLPLTVAAQRVQISAFPDAYAKWEASARTWLAELG